MGPPEHVRHVVLQLAHWPPDDSSYWPTGHVDRHAPLDSVAPAGHERQPLAVPSAHVAHDGSHAWHVELASAHLLAGQAATHVLTSKKGVALEGQLSQSVERGPLHSRQLVWHDEQVGCPPTSSVKVPSSGHSGTHAPLERKGVAAPLQLRQSLLLGPVQLPHDVSHAAHELPLAYLPNGVHEARQTPASRKGCVGAHMTQSAAAGPEHVWQLASQCEHVSGALLLPPEHVKPSSIVVQSPLQPSPPTVLPSSHSSLPTRSPSPHTEVHTVGELRLPPVQV